MSPSAPPAFEPAAARSWIAAGVRHELMMRVLPALRHDMAGPLSVARMGNTVLRRYLAANPFNAELSLKRLTQTEEQLNGLVALIRGLGRWDVHGSERAPPAELLPQALALARPVLDAQGLQLAEADSLPDLSDWQDVAPARLFYPVIGALVHLQENAPPGGGTVRVQRDGASGLRFLLRPAEPAEDGADSFPPMASGLGPRPLRIGTAALACLAEDLGAHLAADDREVAIAWPGGTPEDAPAATGA
ncbi:MAG: hypothetical protein PGN26_12005 [Xylophilus ampelinus]